MEVTQDDFYKQLKQAVKKGYILPYQADVARKKFKKDGDLSILETIEVNKTGKLRTKELIGTKWHDLTEADALRTLVRQNSTIIQDQQSIKGWVTFLGIVTLIGVAASLILTLTAL